MTEKQKTGEQREYERFLEFTNLRPHPSHQLVSSDRSETTSSRVSCKAVRQDGHFDLFVLTYFSIICFK